MNAETNVVLLGFGGPTGPQEIRPFLDRVLEGRPVPRERYEEVVHHYETIGGRSPFNELTQRQADALANELHARGVELPVRVAYRFTPPFVSDVAADLASTNAPVIGVILAVHGGGASWDRYKLIANARYIEPFYEHPLFVEASADRVRDALHRLGKNDFAGTALIFTAHSIPQAFANPYEAQFHRSAELIASALGAPSFQIAYQSRSGAPSEPWLEPDVGEVLRELPQRGERDAVVAPIGFLCDHVEVLYDLDHEAKEIAAQSGVRMERAGTLNDHPVFIRMLADLVQKCAA
jgi:ferrochelatase